jgi:hypothetical protein
VCSAWECRFSPNRKKRFPISDVKEKVGLEVIKKAKMVTLVTFSKPPCCITQHLKSPKKIVALFDQVYGTSEMSSIAPYTTGKFRDGERDKEA